MDNVCSAAIAVDVFWLGVSDLEAFGNTRMHWFLPLIEVWRDAREDPRPWIIFFAGLAIPFGALVLRPELLFFGVGFVAAVWAPFLSIDSSTGRKCFLAALAFPAWYLTCAAVIVIGLSQFD